MKTFTDAAGGEWRVSLTIGVMDEIQDAVGLDFLQPHVGDPSPLQAILSDRTFLSVLGACLEPAAGDAPTDPKAIRRLFDGRTLGAAKRAFGEELIDFFRQGGEPEVVRLIEKAVEARIVAARLAIEQMDAVDLEEPLRRYAEGYGSWRASSGSTPAA